MNVEALNKLASIADKLPRSKLNLTEWSAEKETCLIGHALNNKWFRDRGLKRHIADGPATSKNRGWKAVAEFFDIPEWAAGSIFSIYAYPNSRPAPKTMAARIRRFSAEEAD